MEHPTDRREREESLRKLAAELDKITERLGTIAGGRRPAHAQLEEDEPSATDLAPERLLAAARAIHRARSRRPRHLPGDLLGEPAWDILLDLYIARGEGRRLAISAVCVGANVPATTALRHISKLTVDGLVIRTDDIGDGRRVYLSLAASAVPMIERCLADTVAAFGLR